MLDVWSFRGRGWYADSFRTCKLSISVFVSSVVCSLGLLLDVPCVGWGCPFGKVDLLAVLPRVPGPCGSGWRELILFLICSPGREAYFSAHLNEIRCSSFSGYRHSVWVSKVTRFSGYRCELLGVAFHVSPPVDFMLLETMMCFFRSLPRSADHLWCDGPPPSRCLIPSQGSPFLVPRLVWNTDRHRSPVNCVPVGTLRRALLLIRRLTDCFRTVRRRASNRSGTPPPLASYFVAFPAEPHSVARSVPVVL